MVRKINRYSFPLAAAVVTFTSCSLVPAIFDAVTALPLFQVSLFLTPPEKVILDLGPVKDQGRLGTCGTTGFIDAMEYANHLGSEELSEGYFALVNAASGKYKKFGVRWDWLLEMARVFGAPKKDGLPYDVLEKYVSIYSEKSLLTRLNDNFLKTVDQITRRETAPRDWTQEKMYHIEGYISFLRPLNISQLGGFLHNIKQALRSNCPVLGCFRVPEGQWKSCGWEQLCFQEASKTTAYHVLNLIGFDEGRQAFRIKNSWGSDWKDSGYAWVSYNELPQDYSGGHISLSRPCFAARNAFKPMGVSC